jgi:hypothetical protein
VLPALLSLPEIWAVAGVYARSAHPVEAGRHVAQARALKSLGAADLDGVDLVHLAVSKAAVPAALDRLLAHDVSSVDLLIDTPVVLFKHLHHVERLAAFREVWVAEDCTTLPWVPLVRRAVEQGRIGSPRELTLDRAAYRYHGYALLKTLLGCVDVVSARRRRLPGGGSEHLVRLRNGTRARLIGPRDYAAGHWRLAGSAGAITDAAGAVASDARLELLVADGECTGFRLGDDVEPLQAGEAALLGAVSAGETVTARMNDLKRVGLARMLRNLHAGRGAHPLEDGLDDMAVDLLCERLGHYRATPLTCVRSGAARAWIGALTRLVVRG